MNLSSCGVSNDQHIFRVCWKWWRPFLYIYSLKEGPRVSIHCFADFKSSEDKFQCWKWKKTVCIYMYLGKKNPHITGGQQSTPRVKVSEFIGKYTAAKTYSEQWGCTRICEMTWMLTAWYHIYQHVMRGSFFLKMLFVN